VVLDSTVRDAVGKLDPPFGYADRFDETTDTYVGLVWAKSAPELILSSAVIVRSDVAFEHQRAKNGEAPAAAPADAGDQTRAGNGSTAGVDTSRNGAQIASAQGAPRQAPEMLGMPLAGH
jgi:hypothetical protein